MKDKKNMIKNESFKVGRRYSNTAELLTALVRPSKQWGPNQYQVIKKKLNHLFIKISRLAKMTGLSLEHDQIAKEKTMFTKHIRSLKSK